MELRDGHIGGVRNTMDQALGELVAVGGSEGELYRVSAGTGSPLFSSRPGFQVGICEGFWEVVVAHLEAFSVEIDGN